DVEAVISGAAGNLGPVETARYRVVAAMGADLSREAPVRCVVERLHVEGVGMRAAAVAAVCLQQEIETRAGLYRTGFRLGLSFVIMIIVVPHDIDDCPGGEGAQGAKQKDFQVMPRF